MRVKREVRVARFVGPPRKASWAREVASSFYCQTKTEPRRGILVHVKVAVITVVPWKRAGVRSEG